MHAVLVAGSNAVLRPDKAALSAADLLVAVDAGAETLTGAGLIPAVLVGDMDSVTPQTRKHFEGKGVETVVLPQAKDETDLEAALRLVVDRGADRITVYGALGGPRLDHMAGNLLLLTASWLDGVAVRLVDDLHEVFAAQGDAQIAGEEGDLVSLLPLTRQVHDVCTQGLLYPLSGDTLEQASTRSLSNAMTASTARVTHGPGTLLVVHYRGR